MMDITSFEMETLRCCPVCGNSNHTIVLNTNYQEQPLVYNHCHQCECRWLETRMADSALPNYYEHYYRKLVNGTERAPDEDRQLQYIRGLHLASMCSALNIPPKSLLDIGCSTGDVMKAFREDFPECDFHGVEWGDVDRHLAKELGFNVTKLYPPRSFDMVVLSHVLEHMNNPVEELTLIRDNAMADDGIMIIEVPNYETTMHAYRPHHPIAYNKESLANLANKVGLRILYGELHAVPFESPLAINITMVLEKNDA